LIFLLLALCSFNGPNIFTVATPVSYRDASQGTWAQSFQVMPGTANPTISLIVLPGGPGGTTITPTLPSSYVFAPARWNVFLTDPRGAGCNVGPPASTFSTDSLARDILTIIKRAQITDYVIWGASYSTVEATYLESLIEADTTVQRPRAIVLEGTIGHAWNGYEDAYSGFPFQWERAKRSILQPATVALFNAPPYPLGLSSSDWALLISSRLNVGQIPGDGHALHNLLEPIDEANVRSILSQLQAVAARAGPLILAIDCNEMTGSFKPADLIGNQLVAAGANICPNGFTNRWDSAVIQTTVPIYYIEGQDDPDVVTAQSMYHYLTHATSTRTSYVVIANQGHDPFLSSAVAPGCAEPIWNAMASGSPIASLFAACGVGYAAVERGLGQPSLP
jgi:pimeloyl-ACP methyl ester carboxylesterase